MTDKDKRPLSYGAGHEVNARCGARADLDFGRTKTPSPIPGLYTAREPTSIYGYLDQGIGNIDKCFAFMPIVGRNSVAEQV